MIKRLLNGQSKTITSAAIIIGAASLTSRFLGVIRDRILAGQFGAGDVLDSYYAAFRIPDLVYNLIVLGALSAGFIPIFTQYLNSDSKEKAWHLANQILNVILVGLLILCSILFIFTPQIMSWITPGFETEKMRITVNLTRLMFLSPLLLGVSSVLGGILQAHKRFLVFSLAPILYNIGIIIGALFFVQYWGVYGLAFGVILGATLHLLIQIPTSTYLGYRYKPILNLQDTGLQKIFKIMVPRTLTLGVNQINFVIITVIASTLTAGSLAIFNLANNLQIFPVGIFGISFAIAAFPSLASLALKEDKQEFIQSFSNTTRQILFFIIPASVLFLVLRAQIVRVILGSGNFTWEDTILTMESLAMFSISLFAQSLIPLLLRGFYAFHKATLPFVLGLISVGINIVLSLFLTRPFSLLGYNFNFGVSGLALAFSIANIVLFILLWFALRQQTKNLDESRIIWAVTKILVASIAMAIVTQFMKYGIEPYFGTDTFMGIFLQGFLAGLVGLAVFVIVGIMVKSQEMFTFLDSVKRKLYKIKAYYPQNGIDENVDVS